VFRTREPHTPFKPEHFSRFDEGDDARFYVPERMVQHLDDAARGRLIAWYRDHLPAGGRILDLMSSWVSHLPDDVSYGTVAGLGMNRAELDANPRLNERVVHDLNADPRLPFDNGVFDACVIALSVQYLTRPLEVFGDIARVLVPGGICAVSFSNRCFPSKAVAIWRALDDSAHVGLVGMYFRHADGFDEPRHTQSPPPDLTSDPLFVVMAQRAADFSPENGNPTE
jgi:SAM-dependent methyltransferase